MAWTCVARHKSPPNKNKVQSVKCSAAILVTESRIRDKSVSRIVGIETDVFEVEADAVVVREVEAEALARACFTHLRRLNRPWVKLPVHPVKIH